MVNSIPSRLLNSSAGGRGRRQYEAAGRIGLKVARRRSKSPEVVVARDSISDSLTEGIVEKRSDSVFASTDHRVEITTAAPTTEPTESPAAAFLLLNLLAYRLEYLRTSSRRAVHVFESDRSAVKKSRVLPLRHVELETCRLAD